MQIKGVFFFLREVELNKCQKIINCILSKLTKKIEDNDEYERWKKGIYYYLYF